MENRGLRADNWYSADRQRTGAGLGVRDPVSRTLPVLASVVVYCRDMLLVALPVASILYRP